MDSMVGKVAVDRSHVAPEEGKVPTAFALDALYGGNGGHVLAAERTRGVSFHPLHSLGLHWAGREFNSIRCGAKGTRSPDH